MDDRIFKHVGIWHEFCLIYSKLLRGFSDQNLLGQFSIQLLSKVAALRMLVAPKLFDSFQSAHHSLLLRGWLLNYFLGLKAFWYLFRGYELGLVDLTENFVVIFLKFCARFKLLTF